MNQPTPPPDPRDAHRRRLLAKFFRWSQVVWVVWWLLACAFVVVVLVLNAQERPTSGLIIAGVAVLALVALPFGLFILRRIGRVLERSGRPPSQELAADGERKPNETTANDGRVPRLLTGLFGLSLIGGGLFVGISGKLYEGTIRGGSTTRVTEAPVMAWVLGGIAILIGLALLSVPFAKPPGDDKR